MFFSCHSPVFLGRPPLMANASGPPLPRVTFNYGNASPLFEGVGKINLDLDESTRPRKSRSQENDIRKKK
jgi:hypothetical protein